MVYDIAVIGGGVVGTQIARELSKYQVNVCLIEKGPDVAVGITKSNSAIVHPGFFETPGRVKARLNVQGNRMMDQVTNELEVSFKRTGALMLAFNDEQRHKLDFYMEKGRKNGVPDMEILDGAQVRAMEPNVSDKVAAALYAPTGAIISPYELAIAAAENAAENGVKIILNTEVTEIEKLDGRFIISTSNRPVEARFIVNAAGIYADYVNNMISKNEFIIKPFKGEYCLLDNSCQGLINKVLFQTPSGHFKGILATPTVDGNILLGPTEVNTKNKEDLEVTQKGLKRIYEDTSMLVPNIPYNKTITMFAGLRPVSPIDDFIIGEAEDVKGFINAGAIESPGLTSSPAIALMVRDIIDDKCMKLKLKDSYTTERRRIPRFKEMSMEEKQEIIKVNPAYGRIVCRCEMVTEGEIIDAINRSFGNVTLDAVKRRARAGMGRCQGGFCSTRIMELISQEKKISYDKITKHGADSWIVKGKTKEMI